jgi:hypothetical protein
VRKANLSLLILMFFCGWAGLFESKKNTEKLVWNKKNVRLKKKQ